MNRTPAEITAQIHRMQVNIQDHRFDAQARAMFRKSLRMLQRELAA